MDISSVWPVNSNGEIIMQSSNVGVSVAGFLPNDQIPINDQGAAAVALSLPLLDVGTDATGVTPPTGALGIRGWLSGIYELLSGILTVNVNNLASGIAQVSTRDASGNANGIAGNPIITSPTELGLAWSYTAASGGITTATSVTLTAADATGRSAYVRNMQLINTGTTATEVYLANGGTAVWRMRLPASMVAPISVSFNDGQIMTSANTALNFYVVTAGGAVFVNAQGFLK